MTQAVFNDIDPNVTSGTQLASDLNSFKASLLTQHSGPSAPLYAEIGTEWLDSSTVGTLTKKIYDGTQWVSVYTLNTASHILNYGGNNPIAAFSIARTDDSADMMELYRDIGVETSGGIVFTQKNDADVKKTMAKILMESESVTNGAEVARVSFSGMKAGTLTELFSINSEQMFADFLIGTGERALFTDENGIVTAKALQSGANLLQNGNAETANTSAYTETGLAFSRSSTSTDLIDNDFVFKAVSSTDSETLVSETVTLKNGHINHPIVVSLKYKCSSDWTIEILDQLDNVLTSETINSFTPISNEANVKKIFAFVPNLTTTLKVRFTSSAADVLLFDTLEMYSILAKDEDLYFEKEIQNNQSNVDLFTLANTKYNSYKLECSIYRETDTDYAQGIAEFFIIYDRSTSTWKIAKETVYDMEDTEININFNMNGSVLRYSSSDISGTNYVGKINGKIKRLL